MKRYRWIVAAILAAAWSALQAETLPFIQNDFAKARAAALQRKLPLFVECWAPW